MDMTWLKGLRVCDISSETGNDVLALRALVLVNLSYVACITSGL